MHLQKLKNIVWTKRIGHLFERVTDIENIKRAIKRAAKRKTHRPSVQRILNDIDSYARKIQEMLVNETFVPANTRSEKSMTASRRKRESSPCRGSIQISASIMRSFRSSERLLNTEPTSSPADAYRVKVRTEHER